MTSNLFDVKMINERIAELKNYGPFIPEPEEEVFTASETYGKVTATVSYVVRDGLQYFFDSKMEYHDK